MFKKNLIRGGIDNLVIPLVYLILVLVLDFFTPHSTITPLFAIIGLLVFSFGMAPGLMLFWACFYSLVVVSIFLDPSFFHLLNRESPAGDEFTGYVRSATFLVGATLAILLCIVQSRLKQSNLGLIQMLEKLPIPVITSDQDGKIHFANLRAASILGLSSKDLEGKSYFDILADKDRQGATIAAYLRIFQSQSDNNETLLLKRGVKYYTGTTQLLTNLKQSLLMTILMESEAPH